VLIDLVAQPLAAAERAVREEGVGELRARSPLRQST
jgi:hypothetical protein